MPAENGSRPLPAAPELPIDFWLGRRRPTRAVRVGGVGIGGENPLRVQSMTNTDTADTRATVDQIERLVAAGCELVRVTVPSTRDADNLESIRTAMKNRGVSVPLIADIHFTPRAALRAAEHVAKVRINPGNYADKKRFEQREYSDAAYRDELERVAESFLPLVRRCRALGVAMRIGTNHGSLSDRIVNRYGDSPLGMVESALEFLDVCEGEGFREIVFSMKSSNTQVMIAAYRLLAARLAVRAPGEPGYPFHLGVTEAGSAADGRIKSAIGIGALLADGIGDTLRVSLTEDPVREVPVAHRLARRSEARWREDRDRARSDVDPDFAAPFDPYTHERRSSAELTLGQLVLGGTQPVRVEAGLPLSSPGDEGRGERRIASLAELEGVQCEGLLLDGSEPSVAAALPALRERLARAALEPTLSLRIPVEEAAATADRPAWPPRWVVGVDAGTPSATIEAAARRATESKIAIEWCLAGSPDTVPELLERVLRACAFPGRGPLLFSVDSPRPTHAVRALAAGLARSDAPLAPIVLRYVRPRQCDRDTALLEAACDLGPALCDGIGDGVRLEGFEDPSEAVDLAYRILQGARLRSTRTEYISCPSCGRTLFDLEQTTACIQRRTRHLKGVKIGIMGCIVNGPGEMADADFGYVGSGPGRVTLYVGRQVVARNVAAAEAPDRLVELIREHGRWREP